MSAYESVCDHLAEVAVDHYHALVAAHHAKVGGSPFPPLSEDDAAYLFAGSETDVYERLEEIETAYDSVCSGDLRSAVTEYLLVRYSDARDPALIRDEATGIMLVARNGFIPQPIDDAYVQSHMDFGFPVIDCPIPTT